MYSEQFAVDRTVLCCALFVYLVVYFIFCSLAAFCHANFTIKVNWIELSCDLRAAELRRQRRTLPVAEVSVRASVVVYANKWLHMRGRWTTSFHNCGSCWTRGVGRVSLRLRHHRQLTTTAGSAALYRQERGYVPIERWVVGPTVPRTARCCCAIISGSPSRARTVALSVSWSFAEQCESYKLSFSGQFTENFHSDWQRGSFAASIVLKQFLQFWSLLLTELS